MKKIIAIVLSAVIVLALCACSFSCSCSMCGPKAEEPEQVGVAFPSEAIIGGDPALEGATTIKAEDVYDQHGFGSEVCAETGTYRFWAENSDGVEWTVYVLDEEFTDGVRYIPQANEAALTGDGTLELQAGQYVYVQCSANDLTGAEAPAGASYSFIIEK